MGKTAFKEAKKKLRHQRSKLRRQSAAADVFQCGRHGQPESHQRREADRWDIVKRTINEYVTARGEWAGAPTPVNGLPLVIEKRYPYQSLSGMTLDGVEKKKRQLEDDGAVVRNHWFCFDLNVWVLVVEWQGRITALRIPEGSGKRIDYLIGTMMAAMAWSAEAEAMALTKLREMIKPHLYEGYLLTGMFPETSKRTGIMYIFRKLRPTVAIRVGMRGGLDAHLDVAPDKMHLMATLCLHPIGYYAGSFAGVMTPTDDVIAHLTMMRGDEATFWRKANQHPTWAAESGI